MTVLLLALALASAPAVAAGQEALGKVITDVEVQVDGRPYSDPFILQLLETRIGETLSAERVRETIAHLVALGRFEDIQVFAEPDPKLANAINVHWVMSPVRRISRIEITGNSPVPADVLRAAIAVRSGPLPAPSQVPDLVAAAAGLLADRGYRRPTIQPTLLPETSPDLSRLQLTIDSGPRTVVGDVRVTGTGNEQGMDVLRDLRLERGRPYDANDVATRRAALEEELREQGYYEASVATAPTFVDEDARVDVVVNVDRGPRVRVVFAGDPLPENRRETLVPIRRERSVDLDLLEDASRSIETFLREQGFRAAAASYVREENEGELTLTMTVTRGPRHLLRSVDISGNAMVSRADLAALLVLKPGEEFSDRRVATVAAAVTELYRVRGFARASVKPEIVAASAQQQANGENVQHVDINLVITEGPQTVVGQVALTGTAALFAADLQGKLSLSAGRPFYRPQLDADRVALEQVYRNAGFPSVRVDAQLAATADDRLVDVRWLVTEGPRVRVDRILVNGNLRTRAELIEQEIVLRPGEPLGEDALIESQRRLAALGLFRRIRVVELPHSDALTRDILVEVEESPPTTLSYGGGVEAGRRLRTGDDAQAEERIDVAPRAFFEVTRRNLWGKNRSISAFSRVSLRPRDPAPEDLTDTGGYGFNEYRIVGSFREPRFFDTPGDVQMTAFVEQAVRSSFNFRRRGIRLEFGRRLPDGLAIGGRYSLERTRLFDTRILPEDELNIDRLFPQVRLSTFTGTVLRDTRDDPVDPLRGSLLGTDVSLSARSLGSQVGFVKTFSQVFAYRRLPGRWALTAVAGARFGVAVGLNRRLPDGTILDDVPASERFFAGGDSTVRGFVLDRLGTTETLNNRGFPTGGSGLTVLNGELRSSYWKGVGAVAFLDAGNVFRRVREIDLTSLRSAVGGGIRYRSPIGPLRVDVGFNLDPQLLPTGERERRTVFHLSLGQAF